MRSTGRIHLLIVCLCCWALLGSVEGDGLILQAVAWVKMTYAFAKRDPLRVAIKKTLDGKHPCAICKELSRQKAAKTPRFQVSSDQGKVLSVRINPTPWHLRQGQDTKPYGEAHESALNNLNLRPPTPPPRCA